MVRHFGVTAACKYASKLLKAGDAALLLPQAARCKGPLDRLPIAHEACSACFVPEVANCKTTDFLRCARISVPDDGVVKMYAPQQTLVPANLRYVLCIAVLRAQRVFCETLRARQSAIYALSGAVMGTKVCEHDGMWLFEHYRSCHRLKYQFHCRF